MENMDRVDHNDKALRKHVLSLLSGRNAHIGFEDFIADFPVEACGQKIEGLPYTAWQVLEHMRIAQWDILEFSRDAAHVSPKFPKGYWPDPDEPANSELWKDTVERFREDLKQMEELVADQSIDLFAKIPHGKGQTILREALLIADHNAYHLGALLVMRRILLTPPIQQ
ncbi:MAG TPA: DinB family protein [Pyrinomonadaceae bacterium]|nr:DinB family protein [Pyrinomonadaceae bacterium]